MSWGLALAALAAAAGAGLQMAGNQKASNEMERKVRAELLRQKGYQQQAEAAYAQNAKQNTAPVAQKEISTGAGERQAAYETAQAVPLTQGQASVVGNPLAMSEKVKLALSNQARSKMAGYDQWALARMLDNEQANQAIGTVNNFARGSNNVLPLELQRASHAGDSLNQIGQLVGLAGMLAGGGGWESLASTGISAGSAAASASAKNSGGYGSGNMFNKNVPLYQTRKPA